MGRPTIWPDAQQLVYQWLTTRILGITTWTETDDTADAPRIVVEQTATTSDGLERETDLEVTVVATTLDELRALTTRVNSAMWALAADGNDVGYVDEVREVFGFADDSKNSMERRAIATFAVVVRPQA